MYIDPIDRAKQVSSMIKSAIKKYPKCSKIVPIRLDDMAPHMKPGDMGIFKAELVTLTSNYGVKVKFDGFTEEDIASLDYARQAREDSEPVIISEITNVDD